MSCRLTPARPTSTRRTPHSASTSGSWTSAASGSPTSILSSPGSSSLTERTQGAATRAVRGWTDDHPQGGSGHREELGDRPLIDESALREHSDAVADPLYVGEVVAG